MNTRTLILQSLYNGMIDLGRSPDDLFVRRIQDQFHDENWLRLLQPTHSWPSRLISRTFFPAPVTCVAAPPRDCPEYMRDWIAVSCSNGWIYIVRGDNGQPIYDESGTNKLQWRAQQQGITTLCWDTTGILISQDGWNSIAAWDLAAAYGNLDKEVARSGFLYRTETESFWEIVGWIAETSFAWIDHGLHALKVMTSDGVLLDLVPNLASKHNFRVASKISQGLIALATLDNCIEVWTMSEDRCVCKRDVNNMDGVEALAWGPGGILAIGTHDTVQAWQVADVTSGLWKREIAAPRGWTSLAWNGQGLLASTGPDGKVIVWDALNHGELHWRLDKPSAHVSVIAWISEHQFVTNGPNLSLTTYDMSNMGSYVADLFVDYQDYSSILALRFNENGKLAASHSDFIFSISNPVDPERDFQLNGYIETDGSFPQMETHSSIAWRGGSQIAYGAQSGRRIGIWNLDHLSCSEEAKLVWLEHVNVDCLAFSGSGLLAFAKRTEDLINSGSDNAKAYIAEIYIHDSNREYSNDRLWISTNRESEGVRSMDWSSTGVLASACGSHVRVFFLPGHQSPQEFCEIAAHPSGAMSVAWNKQDSLASMGSDGATAIWKIRNSSLVLQNLIMGVGGAGDNFSALRWSPDCRYIAAGTGNSVSVIDAERATASFTFKLNSPAFDFYWMPDSHELWVATASRSRTPCIYKFRLEGS